LSLPHYLFVCPHATPHPPLLARSENPQLTAYSDDDAIATEEKIWDLTQTINVKGVWWGCKYAVIAMRNVSDEEGSVRRDIWR
jgi:hypothetical protein